MMIEIEGGQPALAQDTPYFSDGLGFQTEEVREEPVPPPRNPLNKERTSGPLVNMNLYQALAIVTGTPRNVTGATEHFLLNARIYCGEELVGHLDKLVFARDIDAILRVAHGFGVTLDVLGQVGDQVYWSSAEPSVINFKEGLLPAPAPQASAKKTGRPKGSKNKVKKAAKKKAVPAKKTGPKGSGKKVKRGRPKGAKDTKPRKKRSK